MSNPIDYPGAFTGAEIDEAILKVRTTLLAGDIPLADGALAAPSLFWAAEPTSGWRRNAAGDIRQSILGVDFAVWKAITASGSTNVPSLGIGMVPLRGGLNIRCPNNLVSGSGLQLDNPDANDGNATGVSMRCTTTGAGGAAFTELGKITCIFNTHNDATRTSQLLFLWTDSSTPRAISFSGNNILSSDTGVLTIRTGGTNSDLTLSPNGTGKIVFGLTNPIRFTAGANQRAGETTLVTGTKTIANTSVTANTVVMLSRKTAGGTLGFLSYTLNAGVGFTINSSSATDTSVVEYLLYEVS